MALKQNATKFFIANPLLTIGATAILGFVGYRLIKKATAGKGYKAIVPPIPPVPTGKGNNYTYISQQYSDFADALYDAMSGVGTDEGQIKNIMSKMKTRDDVLALIDHWGKRAVRTPYGWMSDPMTLAQTFTDEMYPDVIDAYVNSAIKQTGYKF
jgi:hypothetical protein